MLYRIQIQDTFHLRKMIRSFFFWATNTEDFLKIKGSPPQKNIIIWTQLSGKNWIQGWCYFWHQKWPKCQLRIAQTVWNTLYNSLHKNILRHPVKTFWDNMYNMYKHFETPFTTHSVKIFWDTVYKYSEKPCTNILRHHEPMYETLRTNISRRPVQFFWDTLYKYWILIWSW